MRCHVLPATLLCAILLLFHPAFGTATEVTPETSHTSWHSELEHAHNSVISTATFSSDAPLILASSELDFDLQRLQRMSELRSLVEQLRQFEKPVKSTIDARRYEVHTVLEHLPQGQVQVAIQEHFKAATRNIALLNENTLVTTISARHPVSPQVQLWGLDGHHSHVLFWRVNSLGDEVRFIGLAVVSPPTLARSFHNALIKVIPPRGYRSDSSHFIFLPPGGLKFPFPLLQKT